MYAEYDIQLLSSMGLPACRIADWQQLSFTRNINNIGSATISVPYTKARWNALKRDTILVATRTDMHGARRLVGGTHWLCTKRGPLSLSSTGQLLISASFSDLLCLLQRRLVAAESGSAQATKSDAAESIVKALVNEQLLSDRTVNGVSIPGWQSFLSLETDAGRGPTEYVNAPWQDVLSASQQVARMSAWDGTYLAFDFEVQGTLAYQFCCYPNQRGVDRSQSAARPLVISTDAGKLGTFSYDEDYTACASALFCTGQSKGGAQLAKYVTNAALEYAGPFSHTEKCGSGQQSGNANLILSQAKTLLRSYRPLVEVSGTVLETENCLLGRDFDFGDRLTMSCAGIVLPAYLEMLQLQVDNSGSETITVTMRGELLDPDTGAVIPTA